MLQIFACTYLFSGSGFLACWCQWSSIAVPKSSEPNVDYSQQPVGIETVCQRLCPSSLVYSSRRLIRSQPYLLKICSWCSNPEICNPLMSGTRHCPARTHMHTLIEESSSVISLQYTSPADAILKLMDYQRDVGHNQ